MAHLLLGSIASMRWKFPSYEAALVTPIDTPRPYRASGTPINSRSNPFSRTTPTSLKRKQRHSGQQPFLAETARRQYPSSPKRGKHLTVHATNMDILIWHPRSNKKRTGSGDRVLVEVNQRYGRGTGKPASAKVQEHGERASWAMRHERPSPAYTTR